MVDREFNKPLLLEVLRAAGTGNAQCADCGTPDPEWASYKLGIFICLNCSGIHRNLPEISRVKSIHLDFWENDLVEFMKMHGNLCAKAKYEAKVPPFYYIPHSKDCLVLKEQWIRAKYEREEFVATSVCHETGTSASAGSREGFLWKRGRDSRQFLKRRFLLSATEGMLKYYTKESKGPKAVISIKDVNAMFQTEKIRNPHGLQITYSKEGQTRNLFVYHESGKNKEAFKKHWFSLDSQERNLFYFKGPLDAFELGRVFIGSKEQGYEVQAGLPRGVTGKKCKAGLTIVTPHRKFVFVCENDREQKEWTVDSALNEVISQPVTA
ncbi:arf-GAP with dual PH domain-containing protein 2 isoform X3 [Dermochelys coriacea]|uniref:arf-GAP with dual PH domain-containing protein 2 isoform X3 n=1 Tax=Dermochelys coriacea TaxID=27794 RepID=UPI001CAA3742|nr:arf-GAP with dual PH domain-containing protein 2 isoform X3 [Dermochelys coriacea]